ncbi:MAG: hypothetical protein MPW14_03360 [Candidatus Manganitrophus sp.]|nr:MAG: hypothetical protein MPW14_03360 [Candidatus Manganitrophus sp.]
MKGINARAGRATLSRKELEELTLDFVATGRGAKGLACIKVTAAAKGWKRRSPSS